MEDPVVRRAGIIIFECLLLLHMQYIEEVTWNKFRAFVQATRITSLKARRAMLALKNDNT